MASASFELNPAGVLEMLNDTLAVAHVTKIAKQGAEEAGRVAPEHTGDYKASLVSSPGEPTSQGAKASFGSTDWAWHMVEFGSVNNPAYRPLTKAAMSLGLNFEAM